MKRAFVYFSALVGVGGVVYLAGRTEAQQPPVTAPVAVARPTIAVFNIAAVMRDYKKAKFQVYKLNEKRTGMSGDLGKWRSDYIEKQKQMQIAQDTKIKDVLGKELVDLARRIEDRERDINKALNDEASMIISTLYDEIKSVVDKTAEMNGYQIVFAYPDAVTPDDVKNPYLKELKLKPPAAQPFFVSRQVDITSVVITALNNWYPAPDVPDGSAPQGSPTLTPPQAGPPGTTGPQTRQPGQ